MFTAMLFAFFFFLGFLAMFIYSERKRENLVRGLSDEHAQLRVLMRALESRMERLETPDGANDAQAAESADEKPGTVEGPEHDPLLRLSFDEPGKADPALELLADSAGEKDAPSDGMARQG